MLEIYKRFWSNYGDFDGVTSRGEYWTAILLNYAVYLIGGIFFAVICVVLPYEAEDIILTISIFACGVFTLAILIPTLSITVRRLHDVNISGWFILFRLIPMGNLIILIFTLMGSNHINNRWVTPMTVTGIDQIEFEVE
ncbi:MAG: DUF805 domain-containing protein [Mogibacterium sp.]|nr:DUF805 domain-containing protein [Mogibacterium sp.]